VNNKIINELGSKVNHRKDVIVVDGQRLSFPDQSSIFWIALNKPKSLLTTMHDDMNRETILSLIPRANELRLIPVGGLDRDHTGLMLLTNEIGWIHPLTHPSYSHSSRYEVVITGFPTEAQLEMLRKGVTLEGDRSPCPGCSIAVIDIDNRAKLCLLDVQLDETTPSQLERMMEFIDHPVVSLKRLEFCNVKLKALRRGQWRELSKAEVDALKSSCQKLQTSTDCDSKSRPSININRDTNSRPSIRDDSDANSRPSITTNRDTNSRPSIKTDRDINSRPSIRDDSDSKSRPSTRDDSDAKSRPSFFSRINARLLKDKPTS
jgi:23S rRNA pseudouridine2605 synthase